MLPSPLTFLLLFLCFLEHPVAGNEENSTVELVQILYRHGARSPITIYPNDPYSNVSAYWPMGLGQLTKEGKAMQYALGRWLRARYKTLVSMDWRPEEITIRSTDTDRTLMSAACNLAAFYYPDASERFETDLAWIPTPIHTVPVNQDKVMSVDESCPRVAREEKKVEQLPEVKKIIDDSQVLFKQLSEKTGKKVDTITEAGFLYDTLTIESQHNLTLPSWTVKYMDQMKELSHLSFKLLAYNQELKRLRAGPLIKTFGDNMKKKVRSNSTKTKMHMFSGHDTTVSVVLEALGVYDDLPPPYAATILIELHTDKDQQHFVKMYYRNDTAIKQPPYPLNLPGCSEPCLLDDWLSLTSSVVSHDWNKECQSAGPLNLPANTLAAIGVAMLLGALFLILLTYNLVSWHRQKSHFAYQAVPSSSP